MKKFLSTYIRKSSVMCFILRSPLPIGILYYPVLATLFDIEVLAKAPIVAIHFSGCRYSIKFTHLKLCDRVLL